MTKLKFQMKSKAQMRCRNKFGMTGISELIPESHFLLWHSFDILILKFELVDFDSISPDQEMIKESTNL